MINLKHNFSATIRHENLSKHWKSMSKNTSTENEPSGSYTPITCLVDVSTKIDEILTRNSNCKPTKFLMCGLHTCGDLAAVILRLFLESEKIQRLCLIGCCYHLIEEQFFRNPFAKGYYCRF